MRSNQRPEARERTATAAERAADAASMDRARAAKPEPARYPTEAEIAARRVREAARQTVREQACLLCQCPPGIRCTPDGDHLKRWLDAYDGGLITRADMAAVIRRVVIITRWQTVTESAA